MTTLNTEIAACTPAELTAWLADNDRAEAAALAEVERLTVTGRTTKAPADVLRALKNAQKDASDYGLIGMRIRAVLVKAT